jgi:hypothetical protein
MEKNVIFFFFIEIEEERIFLKLIFFFSRISFFGLISYQIIFFYILKQFLSKKKINKKNFLNI